MADDIHDLCARLREAERSLAEHEEMLYMARIGAKAAGRGQDTIDAYERLAKLQEAQARARILVDSLSEQLVLAIKRQSAGPAKDGDGE